MLFRQSLPSTKAAEASTPETAWKSRMSKRGAPVPAGGADLGEEPARRAEEEIAREPVDRGLDAALGEDLQLVIRSLDPGAEMGGAGAEAYDVDPGIGDDEERDGGREADGEGLEKADGCGGGEDRQHDAEVVRREVPALDAEPAVEEVEAEEGDDGREDADRQLREEVRAEEEASSEAAAGQHEAGERAAEPQRAGEHGHAEDGKADHAAERRRREVRDAGAAQLAVGVDLAAGGDLEAGGVEQAAEERHAGDRQHGRELGDDLAPGDLAEARGVDAGEEARLAEGAEEQAVGAGGLEVGAGEEEHEVEGGEKDEDADRQDEGVPIALEEEARSAPAAIQGSQWARLDGSRRGPRVQMLTLWCSVMPMAPSTIR